MNINLVSKRLLRSHSYNYFILCNPKQSVDYCRCASQLLPIITSNYSTHHKIFNRNNILDFSKRWMCTNNNQPSSRLPPLMNFPEIVWPSLIKSIRNFILATFIIKPYFDRDFNLPDFVQGTKQALEVVSNKIASGELKSLNGFLATDIIPKVQGSVSLMSLAQRELLAINKDDIYFSFPYQVGVIFNDEEGVNQKRYVEITMVFHSLRGLAAMRSKGEEPPINMGMLPEFQNRISICNYRFIREYTKGVESDWTVNLLNHFQPGQNL